MPTAPPSSCLSEQPLEYSNPKLPEHINTSREHPLKEFAILTGGILLVCVLVIVILGLSADHLTKYIPFHYEQALFGFESAGVELIPGDTLFLIDPCCDGFIRRWVP